MTVGKKGRRAGGTRRSDLPQLLIRRNHALALNSREGESRIPCKGWSKETFGENTGPAARSAYTLKARAGEKHTGTLTRGL